MSIIQPLFITSTSITLVQATMAPQRWFPASTIVPAMDDSLKGNHIDASKTQVRLGHSSAQNPRGGFSSHSE